MGRKPATGAMVPAIRPDLSLSPEEADLSSAAVDAFTVAVGGRQALLDTLAVADGTPEIHQIVNFLIDARYADWSLRRICAQAGLTIADLFVAYRKALLVRAHLQATRVVTENLVQVVEDVMRRARPYEVTCDACQGTGSITPEPSKAMPNPEPGPCPPCAGTGRLLAIPDLDRQKVALELGQLLQQRSGISIQQNSLTLPPGSSPTAPGALEQLQQAVHASLYSRPPAVDGTVIDAEPAASPAPAPEA